MVGVMTSRIAVALATENHPSLREALEGEYRVTRLEDSVAGVRAVVCAASQGVPKDQLQRFPDLEMVAVFGVGLDKLDLDYARDRGLVLANTPGALDQAVAEHAMALMLAAARRICQADGFVREGEWGRATFPLGFGLSGKLCGIVGLGRIGREIARRAEAFGMTIAYHGRHQQDGVAYEYFESLWALATEADVLVLSLSAGPDTEGLINEEILRALGPHGLLVNVARGSVVDEAALVEALEFGDLGAAALDVFRDEPHLPEGLLTLPNVVLTPHLGSATEQARQAMVEMVLENLRAHFAERPLPGLVRSS